jgi:hypothetical protein
MPRPAVVEICQVVRGFLGRCWVPNPTGAGHPVLDLVITWLLGGSLLRWDHAGSSPLTRAFTARR